METHASGDDTVRSTVIDIVKDRDVWPARYDLRTLRSATTDRWNGHEAELRAVAADEVRRFAEATERGDVETIGATVGEGIGLIHDIAPAGDVVRRLVAEAEHALRTASARITPS